MKRVASPLVAWITAGFMILCNYWVFDPKTIIQNILSIVSPILCIAMGSLSFVLYWFDKMEREEHHQNTERD